MALTTATVVVHAKKRRPPISGTTEGSTVATTRSDSAWIATPPVSITEIAAFPLLKSASQLTLGSLSAAAPVTLEASLMSVSSAYTDAPPMSVNAGCGSVRRLAPKPLTGIDGVVPQRPHLLGIGPHRRFKALPISPIQIGLIQDFK